MWKRTDMSVLYPRFKELVEKYAKEHDVTFTRISEMAGVDKSHLSDLLKRKRKLSAHYLAKFIMGGIFTVAELTEGRDIEATTNGEKKFWKTAKAFESGESLELIAQMKEWGVDIDRVIRAIFEVEKSKRS